MARVEVRPLAPATWPDVERLFGTAEGRSSTELYVGTSSLFAAHGFQDVDANRSSGGRAAMRRRLARGQTRRRRS